MQFRVLVRKWTGTPMKGKFIRKKTTAKAGKKTQAHSSTRTVVARKSHN